MMSAKSNLPVPPNGEILLYDTGDDRTRVECRFAEETFWMSQALMAELFQTSPQNITLHLKAISRKENSTRMELVRISCKFPRGEAVRLPVPSGTTTSMRSSLSATECAQRCHTSPNGALSIQPGATPLDK